MRDQLQATSPGRGSALGSCSPAPRQPRLRSLGPTLALPAALPGQGPTRRPLPSMPGPGLAQGPEGAVASGPLPKGDGMAPQPQSRKTQTLGRVLLKPSPSSPRSPAVPLRPQGPARWSTLASCLFRQPSCSFPRQGLCWPRHCLGHPSARSSFRTVTHRCRMSLPPRGLPTPSAAAGIE